MIEAVARGAGLVLAQAGASSPLKARKTAYARLPLADRIATDAELVKA